MALWRRLRALDPADRRLLVEAGALLVLIRAGLWLLPYRWLARLLPRAPAPRTPPPAFPDRVSWAIRALARRLPGMTCLVQSLAARALLARRGCAAELRLGVHGRAGSRERPFVAHAWVECEGRVVVGQVEDLGAYAVLAATARPADASPR